MKFNFFKTALLSTGLGFFLQTSPKSFHVGDKAENFTLLNQDNKEVSLDSYLGKYAILYFYPKDNTPGCTKEACSLQADWDIFTKKGIDVIGISYDSVKSHKNFAKKQGIKFNLLSDGKKKVAKRYSACSYFLELFPMPFPKRKTFIIDPKGYIVEIINNVDVGTHTYMALKIIDAHKKGLPISKK